MTEAEVNDLRARLEKSEATRAKLRSSLIALKVPPSLPRAAYQSNDNAGAVTASCAHAPILAAVFCCYFPFFPFFFRDGSKNFLCAFPHPPPSRPLTHLLLLPPPFHLRTHRRRWTRNVPPHLMREKAAPEGFRIRPPRQS